MDGSPPRWNAVVQNVDFILGVLAMGWNILASPGLGLSRQLNEQNLLVGRYMPNKPPQQSSGGERSSHASE